MNGLPVIITRAEPGATQTARRVEALGFTALVSPVLMLQADPAVTLPPPDSLSGLIFTSANGVRFYIERETAWALDAWCVGPSTAQAAREAGFARVHESAGNARQLADFIAGEIAPPSRPLLHVANAAASGELQRNLAARGYPIVFTPLYRADTAPALSEPARLLLTSRAPAIVLVHSAKGAQAFARLSTSHALSELVCVAISTAATRPLRQSWLRAFHVAREPNEDALLDALKVAGAILSA